jgi:hypothetical protein
LKADWKQGKKIRKFATDSFFVDSYKKAVPEWLPERRMDAISKLLLAAVVACALTAMGAVHGKFRQFCFCRVEVSLEASNFRL